MDYNPFSSCGLRSLHSGNTVPYLHGIACQGLRRPRLRGAVYTDVTRKVHRVYLIPVTPRVQSVYGKRSTGYRYYCRLPSQLPLSPAQSPERSRGDSVGALPKPTSALLVLVLTTIDVLITPYCHSSNAPNESLLTVKPYLPYETVHLPRTFINERKRP
mgnify:CR=1 FL=1|jgi:hypothetical protein